MSYFTRRQSLALLAGAASSSAAKVSFAQGLNPDLKGRKFIFVILRGAMDGLSALIPNDKDWKVFIMTGRRPLSMPAQPRTVRALILKGRTCLRP